MLTTHITIEKNSAKIYFTQGEDDIVEILDEDCIEYIVERLSLEITNKSYIIKEINSLKRNKLESLERIVNEFYDTDIIQKSNSDLFTEQVQYILDKDKSIKYAMTDKNTKLVYTDSDKKIYIGNPKDLEIKFYMGYIDGDTLVTTNRKYKGSIDDLVYFKNTGRLYYLDLNEFITVYNIK